MRDAHAAGDADGIGLAAIDHHRVGAIGHLHALGRALAPFSLDAVPPNIGVEIDVSIAGNDIYTDEPYEDSFFVPELLSILIKLEKVPLSTVG